MRIAGEQTVIRLDQRFGSKRKVMDDMQALYGGEIKKTSGYGLLGRLRPRRLLQAEGIDAEAYANQPSVTVYPLKVSELAGAMQWTALQAYRAKGGIALEHLKMEPESGPGYDEWASRKSTSLVRNMQVVEKATSFARTATGDPKVHERLEDAYICDAKRHLWAAGLPDFFATVPSLAKPDAFYTEPEATTFHAFGDDLLDAAYSMANGYSELISGGEDAGLIVAHALGASSLEHLGETWRWAETRPTPLEAGQAMLRGLAAGPNVIV
ncbi:MAG TPA: hypothetical protein VLG11_01280 [Candidatus Saccharimonadales bacterium]|nr:hypothetical protein [Candidatus Saccharimonadales bacterium]